MKVDQDILPVVDYLLIDLIEKSGVLILLNPYRDSGRGEMERLLTCKHCPERMKSHGNVSMMEHTTKFLCVKT